MKRLAIVTTHPIQYYAPLFKMLAKEDIVLKVFYTWGEQSIIKYDPGFKKVIEWDIPLLNDYDYEFLTNTSSKPGSNIFWGIKNPDAITKISQFRPHAILVFGWSYYSHLNILRYFKGKVPIWFRGDSTLLDDPNGVKRILKRIFLRWIYSCVDKAFYVGTNNKKYYEKFGLKQKQLIFSPHAIENERFSSDFKEQANTLRQNLAIADNEILILFAGKFEEKKDPLLLLNAFIALQNPSAHLLFVGNGDLEELLKRIAKNSDNKIHFMDFQNQLLMPVIYQACDLFCLPSKGPGETWGLAINEAMACGKAILASNKVGSAIDLVKTNINGYIFKAGSKEDIFEKLKHLCDLQRLKEFGNMSAIIIKEWSLEVTTACLIKELQNENCR